MSTFMMRKARRMAHYYGYVYKQKLIDCPACEGKGYELNGDFMNSCSKCEGKKKIRHRDYKY